MPLGVWFQQNKYCMRRPIRPWFLYFMQDWRLDKQQVVLQWKDQHLFSGFQAAKFQKVDINLRYPNKALCCSMQQ